MADNRKTWTYINQDGDIKTEPVTIQSKIWAQAASASGVRDPDGRTTSQPRTDGWTDETPYGDEFNFISKLFSLFLSELESKGVLSWSAFTDYTPPAVVTASDGNLYTARQASGPGGAGAKDPITQLAYWQLLIPPRKSPAGLIINPNTVDPDRKFDISPGSASASNKISDMYFPSNWTKDLNLAWSPGSGGGARFSGVPLPAPGWLHVFLIRKDADGSVDVGCDLSSSLTPANIPAGYTAYKRIGSLEFSSGSNIVPFLANEMAGGAVEYTWAPYRLRVATTTVPGTRTLFYSDTAPGIRAMCRISVGIQDESAVSYAVLVTSPDEPDMLPSAVTAFTVVANPGNTGDTGHITVRSNTSQEIAYRGASTQGVAGFWIVSRGWIDDRLD